jgi:hypothetical protein
MSYGYEPPKQDSSGSWGEIFVITWVIFGLLAPFMGAIFGVITFVVVTVLLMGLHPLLGLIPLALLAAGAYWVLRRERQKADEDAARIRGD